MSEPESMLELNIRNSSWFKKGHTPWIKGKHLSDKAKAKLSLAHTGKKLSKETKNKIRLAGFKRKLSLESRLKISNAKKGKKFSEEHKKNLSKSSKGKRSNHWKGGIRYTLGYISKKSYNHPNKTKNGYVLEHRLVMEKEIGRFLKKEEIVHHIDKNRKNNALSNLILFNNESEHQTFERFWEKLRLCVTGGIINDRDNWKNVRIG